MQKILVIFFVFFNFDCGIYGKNVSDILKSTRPAYTVATESRMLNVSSDCRKELDIFREAIDARKLWSLKMLDASGEPKTGFFYGNNFWVGVKTQCADLINKKPFELSPAVLKNNSIYRNVDEEFPPFRVNYFAVHFRHNSTLQYHTGILEKEDVITLGLCLPDTCKTTELAMIIEKIFQERILIASDLYRADYKLSDVTDLKDTYQYLMNWKIVVVGIILFLSIIIAVVGTIYDIAVHQKNLKIVELSEQMLEKTKTNNQANGIDGTSLMEIGNNDSTNFNNKKENTFCKILLCFSIYKNTKSLFETNSGADSIKSIHGLRFISMLWIVLVHVFYFTRDFADNMAYGFRLVENWWAQILTSAIFAVDTFFFLSGFLVAYNFYKQENKKREQGKQQAKFSFSQLGDAIFKRYIRLTPAYFMVLGVLLIYAFYADANTQFPLNEPFKENCDTYWWRNLLYINNLFPVDEMCAAWSWYLPGDMQYFVIAKILTVCSVTYFYTSAAVWAGLMIVVVSYNGYLAYTFDYSYTLDMQWQTRDYLYTSPFVRMAPYLIGIAAAYFLVQMKHKINAKPSTIRNLWILGAIANIGTIFIMYDKSVSVLLTSTYIALSKIVWGLGICWIVMACSTGHGGLLNDFLSMKIFIVLGRLTYCAYLLNPIIINLSYIRADVSSHLDLLVLGPVVAGTVVTTYSCAFVFYLLFETPYVSLLKVLTDRSSKK